MAGWLAPCFSWLKKKNDVHRSIALGRGGETFPVRELFRQQSLRTQWLAEQLSDLHETVGYWNLTRTPTLGQGVKSPPSPRRDAANRECSAVTAG